MKYHCYNCYRNGVYTEVEAEGRFIAEDGRVLCPKCAEGVTPCSTEIRQKIESYSKLREFEQKFDGILESKISVDNKDVKLGKLMSQMEKEFDIPLFEDKKWNSENKEVIALYRKVSAARKF